MLAPFALTLLLGAPPARDTLPLRLTVDSTRHEVLVEYRVPPPGALAAHPDAHGAHAGHGGSDHEDHPRQLIRFQWPISGWLRGAAVELEDSAGRALPQALLHHINLLNFDRRQLVHPAVERMYAAGQETRPILLPPTVGIPVREGMRIGLLMAFSPAEIPAGSLIRLRVKWSPSTMVPRPLDVYPVLLDVGFRPGQSPAYDLPPGESERSFEFTLPVAGRVLGVGGHLHDYGRALTLEDVSRERVVVSLEARLNDRGAIESVPVRLFGVTGNGRPLAAGRPYRLRVSYDNRAGRELRNGAMGEMALLFAPARGARWPQLELDDPAIIADLEGLGLQESSTR